MTYLAVSWPLLGMLYLGINRSGKTDKVIKYFNLQNKISPKAGSFAVSFVIYKMLIPVRIAITLAIIPTVFKQLHMRIPAKDKRIENAE